MGLKPKTSIFRVEGLLTPDLTAEGDIPNLLVLNFLVFLMPRSHNWGGFPCLFSLKQFPGEGISLSGEGEWSRECDDERDETTEEVGEGR